MSVAVYGVRYFGRVDVVPGLFHVATKFWHLNYFPIIPQGSAIIYANSDHKMENGKDGIFLVNIPFSWKSYFMAYKRFFLRISWFISLIILWAYLCFGWTSPEPGKKIMGMEQGVISDIVTATAIASLVLMVLLYWSYRGSLASRERALELAQIAGFNEQLVLEQLTFRGYPFRSPARVHAVRRCKRCRYATRGLSGQDGVIICRHCSAPIERPRKGLIFAIIVMMIPPAVAAYGYYYQAPGVSFAAVAALVVAAGVLSGHFSKVT